MSEHHRTPDWKKTTAIMRPRLAASLPAPCVQPRCRRGGVVSPGESWDVAHIVSVEQAKAQGWTTAQMNHPSNLGVAHVRCNRSDGGKAGAAKANGARRTLTRAERRLPSWLP
jgi:hypothetical protein